MHAISLSSGLFTGQALRPWGPLQPPSVRCPVELCSKTIASRSKNIPQLYTFPCFEGNKKRLVFGVPAFGLGRYVHKAVPSLKQAQASFGCPGLPSLADDLRGGLPSLAERARRRARKREKETGKKCRVALIVSFAACRVSITRVHPSAMFS